MNAFSKQADELLQRSIELDNAAKPGESYDDPVWGHVTVPSSSDNTRTHLRTPGTRKPECMVVATGKRYQLTDDCAAVTCSNCLKVVDKYCPKCGRPKSEPHCGFGESWQ